MTQTKFKWKTILGLVLLLVAIAMNWMWVFGVLFILWALNDIATGETHFVERIQRGESPALFWVIVLLWLLLSGYLLFEPWLQPVG